MVGPGKACQILYLAMMTKGTVHREYSTVYLLSSISPEVVSGY